jgi:2-methylcitrate dehydratase PrpD
VDLDGDGSAEPVHPAVMVTAQAAMKPESLPARSPAAAMLEFLGGLSVETLPPQVVRQAKWALLDTLGCAIFGSRLAWARIIAAEMLAEGPRGTSTIIGERQPVAAPAAALANGTAAHGYELDDHLDAAVVHPGAVVVSAVLAAAEAVDAPGSRLLAGIVAGYETLNRVGLAMGLEPAHRGFHKTAVAGPVGAAVAAGVIMRLTPTQLVAAVGLACSAASGIKSYASGTGGGMMKRLHAGRAAESGVRMAQLAARDFTAPPSALDGRYGLLEVFGGGGARPELLASGLGMAWAMDSVYVKVYPCCAWIQSAVQQLVVLRGPGPLAPEAIRRVRIGISGFAAKFNGQVEPPDTMGAQYSIPYCAALALTADPADPGLYREEAIDDPSRRGLARRIELYVDAEMEAAYPRHYGSRVELELADGKRSESRVLDPHGMPADPCSEAERREKFLRLAGGLGGPAAAAAVQQAVLDCEHLASVREILRPLR